MLATMRIQKPLLASALLVVGFIATSCSFHAKNWTSSNAHGLYQASFKVFNGKEIDRVKVQKGDLLFVSASVELRSGGLTVAVQNGGSTLWRKSFTAISDSAEVQLLIDRTGECKISIAGQEAEGSFHIGYKDLTPKPIEVKSDKNIELFGLLMQLNLGPDILGNTNIAEFDGRKAQWRDWYRVAVRNYQRYKSFSDAPVMKLYRDYASRGFYDDFFIGFLLQVDEVPHAKLRTDTDRDMVLAFSKTHDYAEAEKAASEFLEALNKFYQEIRFDSYLAENRNYYDKMLADVRKNLPPPAFAPAMENFYQKSFNHYCLVPSLNIPTSMGFGKMHKTAGVVYNTFGPFSFQSLDQNPPDVGFDYRDKVLNLSVHEFGHSFVNPSIDKLSPGLIKETEQLFIPLKEEMTRQGYPSWTICLYEHFVRAGEVIIARQLGNTGEADRILSENAKQDFIYLPAIVSALEAYNRNKYLYSSYDDIVPLVVQELKPAVTK